MDVLIFGEPGAGTGTCPGHSASRDVYDKAANCNELSWNTDNGRFQERDFSKDLLGGLSKHAAGFKDSTLS